MLKARDLQKLEDYTNHVNENLFGDDRTYQGLLSYFVSADDVHRLSSVLHSWSRHIPSWNVLADEAARPEKLPRLEKYDCVGNPVERVHVPLETKLIRHRVVEAGIFDNQSETEMFSKAYLLGQIGESGVTCPLACTDGLVRVLQAKGSEYLKNKFLDQLKSSEVPLAGAQFITEKTGGSDVGAIEAKATPVDGEYRIHAQKWYCSTPEEFFLVAARPEGAESGTRGLSIFLVPRMVPGGDKNEADYVINNLSFKRLKDKFGTQSLPTAEIDFEGSLAYLIGHEADGFSNLMNYVLNCSRIHNSAAALGAHRRAFVEARNYAEQRVTFGEHIINHPLVGESLISLHAHLTAKQCLFLYTLQNVDQKGWCPEKDREELLWQRFLINLTKYRTSFQVSEQVKNAILVFGANGVINDFSILPRLLRDATVMETWEGTHNTLCLQIMRDLHRFDLMGRLAREVEQTLNLWPEGVMTDSKKFLMHNYDLGQKIFTPQNLYDPEFAQKHARRFVDHFATLIEVGLMIRVGMEQKNCNLLIEASYLLHEYFSDQFSGFESPTIEHIKEIGLDIIRERPLDVDLVFKYNERNQRLSD